jgi:sugar O-acyltransferase (sialic acid O-acetyltransferase NeuD family)
VTNKPIIILGAGGHAKVIAEVLRLSNVKIHGFVTPDLEAGTEFFGATILGDDAVIFNYSADEIQLANGVGALPGQFLRWALASAMRKKGYRFTTIVHQSTVVATDVVLEEGVQLMAGVVIQPGTTVGRDTIINTGTIIDHDCCIAENCHLAPGVVSSGGVEIGKNVHVGTGVKIIQGVNIGEASMIAAGSTIYKDVPAGMLVKQKLNTVMEVIKA